MVSAAMIAFCSQLALHVLANIPGAQVTVANSKIDFRNQVRFAKGI